MILLQLAMQYKCTLILMIHYFVTSFGLSVFNAGVDIADICWQTVDDVYWTHYSIKEVVVIIGDYLFTWNVFTSRLSNKMELKKIWPQLETPINAATSFDHRMHGKNITFTLFIHNDTFWYYKNTQPKEHFSEEEEILVTSGPLSNLIDDATLLDGNITAVTFAFFGRSNVQWKRIKSDGSAAHPVNNMYLYFFSGKWSDGKLQRQEIMCNISEETKKIFINSTPKLNSSQCRTFISPFPLVSAYSEAYLSNESVTRLVFIGDMYQFSYGNHHQRPFDASKIIFKCRIQFWILSTFVAIIYVAILLLTWIYRLLFTKPITYTLIRRQFPKKDDDFSAFDESE